MAVCALIAKMIGALYRIPLTNIIGAEGMGLYQMVFPLYTVLLTVSSGGLPVAISKIVAERRSQGDEAGARQVLLVSLLSLSVAGLVAGIAVVLFREKIALVQGNAKAAVPYLGIAPSLLFVAVISCFRGYYQGAQNMLPSALSQIIEQVVKLVAGLFFARILISRSLEWAVFGALTGVSLSELAAMLFLFVRFLFTDARYKKKSRIDASQVNFETAADMGAPAAYRVRTRKEVLKEVYRSAIPVTLGSLVMPMTQVIDSILVINLLMGLGYGSAEATQLFGLATGPVNSLINMPVVITLSLSVALLPKVSECFAKNDDPSADVSQTLKFGFVIGLLSTLLLCFYARPILSVLYSKGLSAAQIEAGARLLKIGGLSVLYVSILQVATSVLQAAGAPHRPALNLLYGAVLKVVFTLVLLPIFGIDGAMAGTVLCYAATCMLDIASMKKFVSPALKFREFLLAPVLSAVVFAGSYFLFTYVLSRYMPQKVGLIISMVVSALAFSGGLFLFGAVRFKELINVPALSKFLNKSKREKKS